MNIKYYIHKLFIIMASMKRFEADLNQDQLRKKIVNAADKRFRTFGFKKTAMAEIAEDLGMSTSNLYRYFPSKLTIAEAFALQCFEEKEEMLLSVLDASMSPSECLKKYAYALLHYNFQQLNDFPKINEIIMALCDENSELIARKLRAELAIVNDIIQQGCEQVAWQVEDVEKMGEAIMSSWVMFSTPTFMKHKTLDELEERLGTILQLLLTGLEKRN